MIQLYRPNNINYEFNGEHVLHPISCNIKANLGGSWELELDIPSDDKGVFRDVVSESVIKAPSFLPEEQLYRIYNHSKTNDGVEAYARPIFFDSADDVFLLDCRPTEKTGQNALDIMTEGTKYSAKSNITSTSTAYYIRKNLMDAINGDDENAFVNRWGGEPLYNNYQLIMNKKAGGDYGVEVRFGKNMLGIEEDINYDSVITRIVPVAYNGYTLPENYVDSPLIDKYTRVFYREVKFQNLKLQSDCQGEEIGYETLEELYAEMRVQCKAMFDNGCDLPVATYTVTMADLSKTEEYKDVKILETVGMGDVVSCYNERIGITTKARVIYIDYDCITETIDEIKLGDYESDFLKNIKNQQNSIKNELNQTIAQNKTEAKKTVEQLQNELDGKIETFYQADDPALEWKPDQKKAHAGDIWYDTENERSYRYNGSSWVVLKDADAQKAYDLAKTTAHIFSKEPVPPYKANDLWSQGTAGDLMICINERESGTFDATDWDLATKYTDDGALTKFIDGGYKEDLEKIQTQIDGKAETWRQETDPSIDWGTDEIKASHKGDLWYNTTDSTTWYYSGIEWQEQDVPDSVFDAIDGKAQIFGSEPTTPYHKNDLWVEGATGDIKKCVTDKLSGTFSEKDWVQASKYTDDTLAEAVNNALNAVLTSDGEIMAEKIKGIIDGMTTQLKIMNTSAERQEVRAIMFEDLDETSPLYGAMALGTPGWQIASERTADNKDWNWSTAATGKGILATCIIAGILSSTNYKAGEQGFCFNLDEGTIDSKNMQLNSDGILSLHQAVINGGSFMVYYDDAYGNKVEMFAVNKNGIGLGQGAGALTYYAGDSFVSLNAELRVTSGRITNYYKGNKGIDITNARIDFYSWNDAGNYVGSLESLKNDATGAVGIGILCDQGDFLSLGYITATNAGGSHQSMSVIRINANDGYEPPMIARGATGNILIGDYSNKQNSVIYVKNGVITGWNTYKY